MAFTLTRRRSESGKTSSAIGFPARHTMKPRPLRRCDTSRVKPNLAPDTLTQRRLIVRLQNMHKPTEMSHDAAIPRAWNVAILGVSPAAMANLIRYHRGPRTERQYEAGTAVCPTEIPCLPSCIPISGEFLSRHLEYPWRLACEGLCRQQTVQNRVRRIQPECSPPSPAIISVR